VDRRVADPSQQAIARELTARIEEALRHLPTGQRAALHLSSIGYSLPEVAEMLGTTHANARVLVHRARRALECLLGPFLTGGTP
jgi:RNA polymerase sigma factor (sigma-70 family)